MSKCRSLMKELPLRILDELTLSKGILEKQLSDMDRSIQTCQEKNSSLFHDNSRLVTECDSLASTVKTQNGEVAEVKKAIM